MGRVTDPVQLTNVTAKKGEKIRSFYQLITPQISAGSPNMLSRNYGINTTVSAQKLSFIPFLLALFSPPTGQCSIINFLNFKSMVMEMSNTQLG
jgi:hypothetical protein